MQINFAWNVKPSPCRRSAKKSNRFPFLFESHIFNMIYALKIFQIVVIDFNWLLDHWMAKTPSLSNSFSMLYFAYCKSQRFRSTNLIIVVTASAWKDAYWLVRFFLRPDATIYLCFEYSQQAFVNAKCKTFVPFHQWHNERNQTRKLILWTSLATMKHANSKQNNNKCKANRRVFHFGCTI